MTPVYIAVYIAIAIVGIGVAMMVLLAGVTNRPSNLRIGACILVVLATLVGEWLVRDLVHLPNWDGVELNTVVH